MYMIQIRILMFQMQMLVVIRYMILIIVIINPNYFLYVSFYYVWNQILSDTIFDI